MKMERDRLSVNVECQQINSTSIDLSSLFTSKTNTFTARVRENWKRAVREDRESGEKEK